MGVSPPPSRGGGVLCLVSPPTCQKACPGTLDPRPVRAAAVQQLLLTRVPDEPPQPPRGQQHRLPVPPRPRGGYTGGNTTDPVVTMQQKWHLWGSLILSQNTSPAPGDRVRYGQQGGAVPEPGLLWAAHGIMCVPGEGADLRVRRGAHPHHKQGQGPVGKQPCQALASEALSASVSVGRGLGVPLDPWHVELYWMRPQQV